jgi:hypothetical protein
VANPLAAHRSARGVPSSRRISGRALLLVGPTSPLFLPLSICSYSLSASSPKEAKPSHPITFVRLSVRISVCNPPSLCYVSFQIDVLYTDVRLYGYMDVQMYEYMDERTYRHTDVQIYKQMNV